MSLHLPPKHGSPAFTESQALESQIHASPNSHFLHAGQVWVSSEPQSIVLILGSCVAVCVWDPISGIGGATHYLLPAWDGRGVPSARYGNVAISALLQKLVDAGAIHERLRAKVFGGGCLFGLAGESGAKKEHLGSRNAKIATEILAKERIPIDASDIGGVRGQRIVFHTDTGDASAVRL